MHRRGLTLLSSIEIVCWIARIASTTWADVQWPDASPQRFEARDIHGKVVVILVNYENVAPPDEPEPQFFVNGNAVASEYGPRSFSA